MRPADPAPGEAPRATAPWKLALLVAASVGVALAASELALRLLARDLLGRPDPGGAIRMVGRYPGSHDPRLGWLPTPGAHAENVWRKRVTIEADGTRSNGAPPPPGLPVLALGDSFTFGDELDDADTWPAQLERLLGVPVVNAGVFGYGLDQIALRAEDLLASRPAAALVVHIIPDDVMRCEYAYRYAWKPWFSVQDGALALEGVPVPEPDRARPEEPAPRRWLRWSFLADRLYRRLDPDAWLLPDSVRVHRRGVEVGELLVERLDAASRRHGVPWLLALSWFPRSHPEPAERVLARARALGVAVVEIEPHVRAELASGRASLPDLFSVHARPGQPLDVGHMTARGNAVVARVLADALREQGVGARATPTGGS
jgi:hypothetical protein